MKIILGLFLMALVVCVCIVLASRVQAGHLGHRAKRLRDAGEKQLLDAGLNVQPGSPWIRMLNPHDGTIFQTEIEAARLRRDARKAQTTAIVLVAVPAGPVLLTGVLALL